MHQQTDQRPAEGPERRAEADRAAGGAEPEEDVQEVSLQTQLQTDEAGERVRGSGVPGERTYQAGFHR